MLVTTRADAVPDIRETLAGAVDLAAARGARRRRHVHRLDLHALGGAVGRDPGVRHPHRLVLAQAGTRGGRGRQAAHRVGGRLRPAGLWLRPAQTPWWGTVGFIAIEGTVFALAVGPISTWPSTRNGRSAGRRRICCVGPRHLCPALRAARPDTSRSRPPSGGLEQGPRAPLVVWFVGVVFLVIRGLEFTTLNCAGTPMPTARSSG